VSNETVELINLPGLSRRAGGVHMHPCYRAISKCDDYKSPTVISVVKLGKMKMNNAKTREAPIPRWRRSIIVTVMPFGLALVGTKPYVKISR
jgi:hypothetical protein